MNKISYLDKKILFKLNNKIFLITGGSGMLATAFINQINKYTKKTKIYCFNKKKLDVSKKTSFKKLKNINPDYIIHCAALVNADLCEKKRLMAKKNILEGTKNIIEFAKIKKSKIFYPQSFLIYKDTNYQVNEKTLPKPLSTYGKYKLMSEKIILKSLKNSLIIRMGGFFGGEKKDKNFVGKVTLHISKLIKMGIKEFKVGDRVWQPSYTEDLAFNSLILLASNKTGIYNMSSFGYCSFYELTRKIVQFLKISKKIKIKKISATILGNREFAKRPLKLVMKNKRLIKEGLNRQRSWKKSLKEYLSKKYFLQLYK